MTAKCLGSIEDGKTMQDIMPFNWEFVSIAIRKWKEAEEGAALLEQMKKEMNTGK